MMSSCCEPSRLARLILCSVLSDQYTFPEREGLTQPRPCLSTVATTAEPEPETSGHIKDPYSPKQEKLMEGEECHSRAALGTDRAEGKGEREKKKDNDSF